MFLEPVFEKHFTNNLFLCKTFPSGSVFIASVQVASVPIASVSVASVPKASTPIANVSVASSGS